MSSMATLVDDHLYTKLQHDVVKDLYIPSACPKKFGQPLSLSDSSSDDEEDRKLNNLIKKASLEVECSILDSRDEKTSDHWIKRNASLIRLTGKHPFNCEPPLPRLMYHGFITPVPIHFVRNHGSVPRANWEDWTIEVTGLVARPTRFTMEQLVHEFPTREFPATLVCAGNRRKEQNHVKQIIGFNWGAAAISTSLWRGVPLWTVLKQCGIYSRNKGALHVCFEGAEDLPGGGGSKYGTSIRSEIALDPSRDIIIAYMQNGEPLTPDHGFPARMIVPGFIGARMVKWLKRIVVSTQQSDSYYHYKDNRVLPSHVDVQLANTQVGTGMIVGGGRQITRVEVTLDDGETWQVCLLDSLEKPNKYGKYWCWCLWSTEVEVLDLLKANEISVRAWDEALNTQPEKLIWNVMSYESSLLFLLVLKLAHASRFVVPSPSSLVYRLFAIRRLESLSSHSPNPYTFFPLAAVSSPSCRFPKRCQFCPRFPAMAWIAVASQTPASLPKSALLPPSASSFSPPSLPKPSAVSAKREFPIFCFQFCFIKLAFVVVEDTKPS
ncbi:hypothetical protein VNO78_01450 [Psophocarpus tetragonolobus]|uniref:Nitrate reductase n=1 Tax=Psophocarpus tetragonolobus TaxID=3891 RepID=A0AAN9T1S9_PSOTE